MNRTRGKPKIARYLSDENLERLRSIGGPIFERIRESHGEIVCCLRENYVNLYSRGNSLAKITFPRNGDFAVTIHEDFVGRGGPLAERFPCELRRPHYLFRLGRRDVARFFSKTRVRELVAAIKRRRFSDELALEQALITDNLQNPNWVLLDRQVTDHFKKSGIIDLLALRKVEGDVWRLVILEVKLGNNPDLAGKVVNQLSAYHRHVTTHLGQYRRCYERHFAQKHALGLIENAASPEIKIDEVVEGAIVVGGYSGLAKQAARKLQARGNPWREIPMHFVLAP